MALKKTSQKLRLRRGDRVVVLSGRDKGKQGVVLRAYPSEGKLLVRGVNMLTDYVRANPEQNVEGGLVRRESPIWACKVAIVNPEGRPDRIGFRVENGKKVRIYKSTQTVVEEGKADDAA